MKPRKLSEEINDIVSQIEGIVKPLQIAITKLQVAQENVEKDKTGVKTLAAIKEAHLLIQQARKGSYK